MFVIVFVDQTGLMGNDNALTRCYSVLLESLTRMKYCLIKILKIVMIRSLNAPSRQKMRLH
jgi:hypothetical protein